MLNKNKVILSVETSDERTKGIYLFDTEGVTIEYKFNLTPDIQLALSKRIETPRFVKQIGDYIYALTRSSIYQINDKNTIENRFDLTELFKNTSFEESSKKIVGDPTLSGGIFPYKEGIFISLYLKHNPLKKRGYLFYSPDGNISNIKLLKNCNPTQQLICSDSRILVPCGSQLETIILNSASSGPIYHVVGGSNILSAAGKEIRQNESIALITDVNGGYALFGRGKEFSINGAEERMSPDSKKRRSFLPSEATSCAIVSNDNKDYALFGVDDGKILAYSIDVNENCLQYINTVPFLSSPEVINSGNKDNHIHSLNFKNGWVYFTLRNLFMSMSLTELLKCSNRIKSEDEPFDNIQKKEQEFKGKLKDSKQYDQYLNILTEVYNPYLKKLQDIYSLNKIYGVPHRIISSDIS